MAQRRLLEVSDITRIAVFAAIIVVLGLPGAFPAFGGAVPITLQSMGVMLAGAVLGAWRGAASVLVVVVLVAVGLPVLSGGRGGLGVFVGPTGGYVIGWIFGAFITGLIAHAGARPVWWRTALGCIVGGIGVVYLFGIPVQALVTKLPLDQTILSSVVFLPGDLIKVALTVLITQTLYRAWPAAFSTKTPRSRQLA